MANVNKPFGLKAIGLMGGGDYVGRLREVEFLSSDGTACYIGQPVKLTGTVGADGKTPVVTAASAGDAFIGALESLKIDPSDEGTLMQLYRAASTSRKGYVPFGADVLYICQEDSAGNAIEISEAGRNVNFVVGSGSTVTGMSAMTLDSDSAETTDSLPLRLHHVYDRPDNVLGDYAIWVVSINASQDDHGTGV